MFVWATRKRRRWAHYVVDLTTFPIMLLALACGSMTLQDRISAEVIRWEGTPYHWGGTSQNGVDCSGFVMAIYDNALGTEIPRTTAEQILLGTEVKNIEMIKPGDLVFFSTKEKVRHVGIYIGEGVFAHSSSSRGVIRSNFTNVYWSKAFICARRILVNGS